MTGIGEKAKVPTSTISRLLSGRTTPATVKAVADALKVSEREILAAATGKSFGPWEPPLEAHLLTEAERDALAVLIRSMAAGKEPEDAGDAEAEKIRPLGEALEALDPTPDNVRTLTPRQQRFHEDALPAQTAASEGSDTDRETGEEDE